MAFAPVASAATQDVDASKQYRTIGARRLYATYQRRIFKGKLPPLLYAIAITETEIDENAIRDLDRPQRRLWIAIACTPSAPILGNHVDEDVKVFARLRKRTVGHEPFAVAHPDGGRH